VQGVTITATSETGAVAVKNEVGDPVSGAQVFRNGSLAGTTSADGTLMIADLAAGDALIARRLVMEKPTNKNNHNQDSSQNWGYRIYITSLDIPVTGEPAPLIVTNPAIEQVLTVKTTNALVGLNIVVSAEWDALTGYLAELQQGFEGASRYLYDASDGQMLFERVTIWDNREQWSNADYHFEATNQLRPHVKSPIGQLLEANISHPYFGRDWGGPYNQSNGFRSFIHEFGHYGLGLYDSYTRLVDGRKLEDAHCTSAAIRTNYSPATNATLMDYQYNASEFAMRDVGGLWSSECENTEQWQRLGRSDWETIVAIDLYKDMQSPARWQLRTPATHGALVAGPTSIPVDSWTAVNVGGNANTGVCDPSPTYRVEHLWGSPAVGADIVLRKGDRDIEQGETDDNGEITVLGAADGDRIIVGLWGHDLRINSTVVGCTSGYRSQATEATEPSLIVLEPAAFDLTVSAVPGDVANEVTIFVKASVELAADPVVQLTQSGADSAQVPVTYDAASQSYSGSYALRTELPQTGTLVATALDLQRQQVQVASAFNLAEILAMRMSLCGQVTGRPNCISLPARCRPMAR